MGLRITVKDGVFHRHESADHDVGDRMRKPLRDGAVRRTDSNSPFNEGFSFTHDEYELLKKIKPHLFDQSIEERKRLTYWQEFAQSSEGRAFRIK